MLRALCRLDQADMNKGEVMLIFERRVQTLCRDNRETIDSLDETAISDEEEVEVNHFILAIFITC